jgi:hypothetical protein
VHAVRFEKSLQLEIVAAWNRCIMRSLQPENHSLRTVDLSQWRAVNSLLVICGDRLIFVDNSISSRNKISCSACSAVNVKDESVSILSKAGTSPSGLFSQFDRLGDTEPLAIIATLLEAEPDVSMKTGGTARVCSRNWCSSTPAGRQGDFQLCTDPQKLHCTMSARGGLAFWPDSQAFARLLCTGSLEVVENVSATGPSQFLSSSLSPSVGSKLHFALQ